MPFIFSFWQESILAVVTKKAPPIPVGKVKLKAKSIFPSATPPPPQQNNEFSQFRTPSGSYNTEEFITLTFFTPGNLLSSHSPAGQFYCAPCNLSLNSTSQFQQHQVNLWIHTELVNFMCINFVIFLQKNYIGKTICSRWVRSTRWKRQKQGDCEIQFDQ